MKTRYIHIGYPKTATSTLQAYFFPKHPELLHLNMKNIRDAVQIDMLCKDSLNYRNSEVKKVFAPYLEQADRSDKCKAVGISYESLSFSFDGGSADRGLIAKRLYDLFGEAKIIITIRNQFDFIQSLYNESIRVGSYLSFDQFLEANYWRFYTYLFSQIYYYDIFECYTALFGKDNIKVVLFEEFKDDPNRMINQICSFLGISQFEIGPDKKRNFGLSHLSLKAARIVNRIFKNDFGRAYFMPLTPGIVTPGISKVIDYIPRGITRRNQWRRFLKNVFYRIDGKFNLRPAKHTFSKEWTERITDLYRENNRRLIAETGLDLTKYKYPL